MNMIVVSSQNGKSNASATSASSLASPCVSLLLCGSLHPHNRAFKFTKPFILTHDYIQCVLHLLDWIQQSPSSLITLKIRLKASHQSSWWSFLHRGVKAMPERPRPLLWPRQRPHFWCLVSRIILADVGMDIFSRLSSAYWRVLTITGKAIYLLSRLGSTMHSGRIERKWFILECALTASWSLHYHTKLVFNSSYI